MGAFSDPALILPGAITNTEVAAAAAIAASKLQSIVARTISGNYVGNSSNNRAISHGLGKTPTLVLLYHDGSNYDMILAGIGQIQCINGLASYATTVPDGTNFYVGNAGNYTQSANLTGVTYQWVVVA